MSQMLNHSAAAQFKRWSICGARIAAIQFDQRINGAFHCLALHAMLGEDNDVATSSVQSGVRITAAALLTWADLNTNIAVGDGYYSTLPGVARSKALRIKNHVALLLAQLVVRQQAAFALVTGHRLFCPSPTSDLPQSMVHLPCPACSDQEAIDCVIGVGARTQSSPLRRIGV